MLYEFLAISPDNDEIGRLERRLACATNRILEHFPDKHLYFPIFFILMKDIFEIPSKEEMEKLKYERETADLEELPYPIMYTG